MIGLLAFDPGNTTGWTHFDQYGDATRYGQATLDELIDLLNDWDMALMPVDIVVYESFKVLPQHARGMASSKKKTNDLQVSQAIGAIKAFARRHKLELVEQRPADKKMGEMFSGVKPPGTHAYTHWVDAYNQGVYYMVKNNLRKTRLEEQIERESL